MAFHTQPRAPATRIIPTNNIMGERLAVGSQIGTELIKDHIESFDYAGKSLEIQAQYSQNRAYDANSVTTRCSFELAPIPVVVVRFDATCRTRPQAAMAMRLMSYICYISDQEEVEEDAMACTPIITALITALNIMGVTSTLEGLMNVFKGSGYELSIITCNWDEFNATIFPLLPGFEAYNNALIDRAANHKDIIKLYTIIAGLSFMFVFKNANQKNMDKYCENRLRAFCNVMGCVHLYDVAFNIRPGLAQCNVVKSVMGSVFEIRKEVFMSATGLASVPWDGQKLFKTILELLSFNELMHIHMIDTYLCKMYRELLVVKALRAERSNYVRACEYLLTIPRESWAYAKILYPPTETEPLLSKNMPLMGCAASIIMKKINKTGVHYAGYKNIHESFTRFIAAYVDLRNTTATFSMVDSNEAQASKTERDRLIKQLDSYLIEADQVNAENAEDVERD